MNAPSAGKKKCFMLLVERGERQWLLPIARDPVGIGRSPNNHVSVEDSQLAPRHLRIIPLGEEIWAKDMGSPAGFSVNGRWLREARLRAGDEIVVGELRASLLVEETSTPPPAPAPIVMPEAPELPPTPVRRRSAAVRKTVPAWVYVSIAVSALVALMLVWVSRSAREEEKRKREASWVAIERARNDLKEKRPGKARESLRGIEIRDAEIDSQASKIEKDIDAQEAQLRQVSGREEGDEYYQRYLLPLLKSNEIVSDIRWENVAWRRCDEFLERFPNHPLASIVKARRDRFASGSPRPPAPRFDEIEIDVRQLMQAKTPNCAMARERVVAFLRENLGGTDDLPARELLRKIDVQVEEYFEKSMEEAKKLWNQGNRDQATSLLDRVILEIGRADLAEQASEIKKRLDS